MCLRAFRSKRYPNKFAFKVVKEEPIGTKKIGYRSPYYGARGLYYLNRTYKASGSKLMHVRKIPANDPRPYFEIPWKPSNAMVSLRSGVYLYTKLEDAKRFCAYWTSKKPSKWVVLKCRIKQVQAYGDDAWGRAVVVQEIVPKEIVWEQGREGCCRGCNPG